MTHLKHKFEALAKHLDLASTDDLSETSWGSIEHGAAEYRVLEDSEADEACAEYVEESLWAFNADFIANFMPDGINADEVNSIRGDRCEDANPAMLALVGDRLAELVEAAIGADGRGHFLAPYDNEEAEVGLDGVWLFIYRQN